MRPSPSDVVRQALGQVLDPVVVEHLRGDSPVLHLGSGPIGSGAALSAADAIAVADAIARAARESGAECLLLDEDLPMDDAAVTVEQLADAVARRWTEAVRPGEEGP